MGGSFLVYNNNIIIITLFKEDSLFGRYASLTYGPQLINIEMLKTK